MTAKQRNRLRMFATVRDYLAETAGFWGGIPANGAAHAFHAGYEAARVVIDLRARGSGGEG